MTGIADNKPAEIGAPTDSAARFSSMDIARGIALFGILIMNIPGMGLPLAAYGNPNAYGGATGIDLNVWLTVNVFFESTMRTIFSLLFGAGLILFMDRLSERLPGNQAADLYMKRNILLVFFGAIHGYLLLWQGDILYSYGLAALFLFGMRHFKTKTFIILIIGLMAIVGYSNYTKYANHVEMSELAQVAEEKKASGAELSEDEVKHVENWDRAFNQSHPKPEKFAKEIANTQSGYWHNVTSFFGRMQMFESIIVYTWFFWDALLCMMIGVVLYRWGVLTLQVPHKVYLAMIVVGYGIGLPLRYILSIDIIDSDFNPIAFDMYRLLLDPGRILVGGAHIGLIMLFCQSGILRWLQHALASVGRMALTNYLSHSIVAIFVFTGVGAALFGELARHELYYIWAAICVFQLITSPIWLKYFRFGPFEWLWRSMTYGQLQSMRKL